MASAQARASEVAAQLIAAGWVVKIDEYPITRDHRLVMLTARRAWFESSLLLVWNFNPAKPNVSRFVKGRIFGHSGTETKFRGLGHLRAWVKTLTDTCSINHPEHEASA